MKKNSTELSNSKKKRKKKYILILKSFLIFLLYVLNQHKMLKKLKSRICICTIAKEENRYIREWVQHYEKYGVDKIYLYDNNDINGEHFESVINDYIKREYVQIFNWRGKTKFIYKAMNECYKLNHESYDWLIFYELDEFIHLSNFKNIKDFLSQKKFDKCKIIYLNLLVHDDNNQLYYENISLFKRFPKIVPQSIDNSLQVKMIIKGGINGLIIQTTAKSYISKKQENLTTCNGFGNFMTPKGFFTSIKDYNFYYVDHFFCKSTEEFINKLKRGDTLQTGKALENYKLHRIKRYFRYNKFTQEKANMMEKVLKINSSIIMKLAKKSNLLFI